MTMQSGKEILLAPDKAISSRLQTFRFAWMFAWPGHKNIIGIRPVALAYAMLVAQLPSSLPTKPCRPSHCLDCHFVECGCLRR
jgi:hypothetical protein